MGKIKSWMMGMEEQIFYAVEAGMKTREEIYSYVQQKVPEKVVDKGYIDSILDSDEFRDNFGLY